MKKITTTFAVAAAALFFIGAPTNSANAGFSISFGSGHSCGYNDYSYRPRYAWRKVKVYDHCGNFAGYRWKRVRVY